MRLSTGNEGNSPMLFLRVQALLAILDSPLNKAGKIKVGSSVEADRLEEAFADVSVMCSPPRACHFYVRTIVFLVLCLLMRVFHFYAHTRVLFAMCSLLRVFYFNVDTHMFHVVWSISLVFFLLRSYPHVSCNVLTIA